MPSRKKLTNTPTEGGVRSMFNKPAETKPTGGARTIEHTTKKVGGKAPKTSTVTVETANKLIKKHKARGGKIIKGGLKGFLAMMGLSLIDKVTGEKPNSPGKTAAVQRKPGQVTGPLEPKVGRIGDPLEMVGAVIGKTKTLLTKAKEARKTTEEKELDVAAKATFQGKRGRNF